MRDSWLKDSRMWDNVTRDSRIWDSRMRDNRMRDKRIQDKRYGTEIFLYAGQSCDFGQMDKPD